MDDAAGSGGCGHLVAPGRGLVREVGLRPGRWNNGRDPATYRRSHAVPDSPTPLEERPVLSGLLALGGVAVVVGLLAGVTVLVATRMLGLGGDDVEASSRSTATSGDSLYLPEPSETVKPSGPLITLDATGPTPTGTAPVAPSASESSSAPPEKQITLSAGQTSVGAMQQIDLTGTYPQGEGAILQVQRFENGAWNNFPVTVSVSNQTFSTYVQTSQSGENRFRVVDTDSQLASNEVVVAVG